MSPQLTNIAKIVCKHVPPTRFCDEGKTCKCWAEYAMPCAIEIVDYITAPSADDKEILRLILEAEKSPHELAEDVVAAGWRKP